MTQNSSDVEIANQGFAAFRQDLNDVLEDITTLHSGTAAPSTTYANQWWYETDTNKLYIRNEDNDAWIEILTLDQANDHLATLGATITLDGAGNMSVSGTITQTIGNVENSAGNALLQLKRTSANTTGRVGGINFLASDGHSVAGVSAIGDGDNEGAYLRFDATSAASSSEINSNEVMRLRQNGEMIITSDGSDNDGAHIQLTHDNNNTTDVIGSILFANSVGEAARIQAETVGANNTGLIKMFADNAGTSRQVFGLNADGNLSAHYNSDTSGVQRIFYDTLINRGTDFTLKHLVANLGTTGDPSGAYVLLCKARSSGAVYKRFCAGKVFRQRGSNANGLINEECVVNAVSAYQQNSGGGYTIGNIGTASIVTCTYASVSFIALKLNSNSGADVSCDLWYGSAAIADNWKPIMVDDGAVSSVSTLHTLSDLGT